MIRVFTGSNDYLRASELNKLVGDFKNQYGEFGLERIDAGEIGFGRLLESVSSLPFLAEKRMIVLGGITESKDLSERIDEFLESVADTTELVINQPKFDKRSKLYKTLKKNTEFKEFNDLDEHGLARWLSSEAKARGGELPVTDANHLIKLAGPNQMGLSQELDKLLSFNSKITKKSIDRLVEPMPNSTIFELVEAAFNGSHKKAIEPYADQRKQQVEPQAIMGMIAWQVHTMTVVKFNDQNDPNTIASNAKINPFVVRKTLGLVSKKSRQDVKDLLSKTLELDVRLKSEPINADDAIQHYLLTI